MMLKRLLCMLAAIALLSGCAAPHLSAEADAKVSRVGVVVLAPEEVVYQKLGLTVFGNESTKFDMRGQVEEAIRTTAVKRLQVSRPNWEIKSIPYDRASLIRSMSGNGLVLSSALERIEGDLAKLATSASVDLLLVFTEARYDRIGGAGVGITERALLGGGELTLVQANVAASLVDRSGRIVAGAANGFNMDAWRIDARVHGLSIPLTASAVERVTGDLVRLLVLNTTKRMGELGY
jgi:hypothetical protein